MVSATSDFSFPWIWSLLRSETTFWSPLWKWRSASLKVFLNWTQLKIWVSKTKDLRNSFEWVWPANDFLGWDADRLISTGSRKLKSWNPSCCPILFIAHQSSLSFMIVMPKRWNWQIRSRLFESKSHRHILLYSWKNWNAENASCEGEFHDVLATIRATSSTSINLLLLWQTWFYKRGWCCRNEGKSRLWN